MGHHRFDHSFQAENAPSVVTAAPSTIYDYYWFPDSEATHHLNADLILGRTLLRYVMVQVWPSHTLGVLSFALLSVPLLLMMFYMFPLFPKIYFLYLSSLLTIMFTLNFILTLSLLRIDIRETFFCVTRIKAVSIVYLLIAMLLVNQPSSLVNELPWICGI